MFYEEWKNRILNTFFDATIDLAGDKHWATVHFPADTHWNCLDLRVRGQCYLLPDTSAKDRFIPSSIWTIEDDYWRTLLTITMEPDLVMSRSTKFTKVVKDLGEAIFQISRNRHILNLESVAVALEACFKANYIFFEEVGDEDEEILDTKKPEAHVESLINPNIPNAEKFGLTESGRLKGYPWMITLNQVNLESSRITFSNLGMFCVSIREQQTGKLICDFADVPTNLPLACAGILEQAVAYCRNCGPDGSDWKQVYLWNDEDKMLYSLQNEFVGGQNFVHFDSKEFMNSLLRIQVNPQNRGE